MKNDEEKSHLNPNPVLTICKISQICQIPYEILHNSY